MKTKIFDAVAESRKWREATSRKLDAMSVAQRLAYLGSVRERYMVEREEAGKSFADEGASEGPEVVKPPKAFDAVAESRKWKEAVARETAGMSAEERIAYFNRHSSVEDFRQRAAPAEPAESCVVREGPPEK